MGTLGFVAPISLADSRKKGQRTIEAKGGKMRPNKLVARRASKFHEDEAILALAILNDVADTLALMIGRCI